MKRVYFLFIPVYLCNMAIAQNDATKSIGIFFPVFANNTVSNMLQDKTGTSYNGNGSLALGINYIYSTCKCSAYEAGIEFSSHSTTITPATTGQQLEPYNARISLLSLPIALRMNFLKYFFVTGGVMLDIDISKQNDLSNQTGFGASFGLGVKYDFKSGFGLYINPYFKSHSWVTFSSQNKQRLSETGIRLGVVLKLKEKIDY